MCESEDSLEPPAVAASCCAFSPTSLDRIIGRFQAAILKDIGGNGVVTALRRSCSAQCRSCGVTYIFPLEASVGRHQSQLLLPTVAFCSQCGRKDVINLDPPIGCLPFARDRQSWRQNPNPSARCDTQLTCVTHCAAEEADLLGAALQSSSDDDDDDGDDDHAHGDTVRSSLLLARQQAMMGRGSPMPNNDDSGAVRGGSSLVASYLPLLSDSATGAMGAPSLAMVCQALHKQWLLDQEA
jgi:hypothetical protein